MRLNIYDFRGCNNWQTCVYCSNESKKNNYRFQKFFSKFRELNIIKDLTGKIDLWSYNKLDEVNRISPLVIEKIKKNGII